MQTLPQSQSTDAYAQHSIGAARTLQHTNARLGTLVISRQHASFNDRRGQSASPTRVIFERAQTQAHAANRLAMSRNAAGRPFRDVEHERAHFEQRMQWDARAGLTAGNPTPHWSAIDYSLRSAPIETETPGPAVRRQHELRGSIRLADQNQ